MKEKTTEDLKDIVEASFLDYRLVNVLTELKNRGLIRTRYEYGDLVEYDGLPALRELYIQAQKNIKTQERLGEKVDHLYGEFARLG